MQVLSTGVDMELPLYEKKIRYTVEACRAAFIVDDWGRRFHYHYRLVKRRGDTMLSRIAQREDLCLIVLPIVVRYILEPAAPRFKPRGKRV